MLTYKTIHPLSKLPDNIPYVILKDKYCNLFETYLSMKNEIITLNNKIDILKEDNNKLKQQFNNIKDSNNVNNVNIKNNKSIYIKGNRNINIINAKDNKVEQQKSIDFIPQYIQNNILVELSKSILLLKYKVYKNKNTLPYINKNKNILPYINKNENVLPYINKNEKTLPYVNKMKNTLPNINKNENTLPNIKKNENPLIFTNKKYKSKFYLYYKEKGILDRIVQLKEKEYGYETIALTLNGEKYKNYYGKKFIKQTIKNIIENYLC
jgi:hypothetical protein